MARRQPEPEPWAPGAIGDLAELRQYAPCVLIDCRGHAAKWDGKAIPSSWGPWRVK